MAEPRLELESSGFLPFLKHSQLLGHLSILVFPLLLWLTSWNQGRSSLRIPPSFLSWQDLGLSPLPSSPPQVPDTLEALNVIYKLMTPKLMSTTQTSSLGTDSFIQLSAWLHLFRCIPSLPTLKWNDWLILSKLVFLSWDLASSVKQ